MIQLHIVEYSETVEEVNVLAVQSALVIRKHLVQIVQIKLVRMKSVYAEM